MLSTDAVFYVCAAVIFLLFYATRSLAVQTLILSIGSLAMYATEGVWFLALLLASCAANSICSYIAGSPRRTAARAALVTGIVINLGVLAAFKYKLLLFSPPVASPSPTWFQEFLQLSLPVGISFYSFHGISLVVDAWRDPHVLRHRGRFWRHVLDTSLYLCFFPQLVAGPITKGKMFFPQIVAKRIQDIPWMDAATNVIVGIFLKRVVADNLNQFTFPLTDPRLYPGYPQSQLLAMVLGYSAQIFADFAGYSLIAIGVAKVFGYQLPDNFNQPYLSQSITEFWRRWHMSLSAWLRDYLYIPLGGNRRGQARTYLNLLIVMGLGGLWHGASWKFAVWGLWHGAWLTIERALGIAEPRRGLGKLPTIVLRCVFTFCLVTIGWLFFRLDRLEHVVLLAHEFSAPWRTVQLVEGKAAVTTIYALCAVVAIFHVPRELFRIEDRKLEATLESLRPYALGVLCAVILMASGSSHTFIYFQF